MAGMLKKSALLLGAAIAAVAGAALAQQAPGPFTAAQVAAGRAEYAENCASCHQADLSGGTDALPLAGKGFMAGWNGRTTAQLYDKIHGSMPLGRGGSLDEKTYTDLVAFILHANGAAAGSAAFTPPPR